MAHGTGPLTVRGCPTSRTTEARTPRNRLPRPGGVPRPKRHLYVADNSVDLLRPPCGAAAVDRAAPGRRPPPRVGSRRARALADRRGTPPRLARVRRARLDRFGLTVLPERQRASLDSPDGGHGWFGANRSNLSTRGRRLDHRTQNDLRAPTESGGPQVKGVRRCPTLPHPGGCSTIGAGGLSFRVRNGSGRFPSAMAAVTCVELFGRGRWLSALVGRAPGAAQWTRGMWLW